MTNSTSSSKKKTVKPVFNAHWFREQIARAGMSQRQLAKMLGIHASAVTHILTGFRKLTYADATKWAAALSVSIEDVLTNSGFELPASGALNASATIAIKGWVDQDLKVHWGAPKGPQAAPIPNNGSGSKVVALRFQTAQGPFESLDGAIFYFRDGVKGIDPDCLGRYCLVKLGLDHLIRVVKRGYEAGHHNLSLLNGTAAEEGVTLSSASPLVWIKN